MFNVALDSKLRGCDRVRLRIDDVFAGGRTRDRATVIQKTTGRPVQSENNRADPCCCRRVARRPRRSEGPISVPKPFPGKATLVDPAIRPDRPSIWQTPVGSIARHTAGILCAERARLRFTRTPAIYEQCSCCLVTRSWRAPFAISRSKLMMRSASRSRSNFNRAQVCGPANPGAAAHARDDRARHLVALLPLLDISLAVSGRPSWMASRHSHQISAEGSKTDGLWRPQCRFARPLPQRAHRRISLTCLYRCSRS